MFELLRPEAAVVAGGERSEMREWLLKTLGGVEREGGGGKMKGDGKGKMATGRKNQEGAELPSYDQRCEEGGVFLGWVFRGQNWGLSQAWSSLESGVDPQKDLLGSPAPHLDCDPVTKPVRQKKVVCPGGTLGWRCQPERP